MSAALFLWLFTVCQAYEVEIPFALAVCQIESGTATQQYRVGVIGREKKYAGPFGLHIAYVREKFGLDATDPKTNIEVGVRALRGTLTDAGKLRVLRRYNTASNRAYERAVLAHYQKLKEE